MADDRAALVGEDAPEAGTDAEDLEALLTFSGSVFRLEAGGLAASSDASTEILPGPPTIPKWFEARSST